MVVESVNCKKEAACLYKTALFLSEFIGQFRPKNYHARAMKMPVWNTWGFLSD
jgi:hypothetical protein